MSATVKISIRTKLLVLIIAVVLLAIVAYLALAVRLFKDDKTLLTYELTAGTVRTLSAEIEAELGKTLDKVKLLTQGHDNPAWVRALFESESNVVQFTVYRRGKKGEWAVLRNIKNPQYLKLYGLKEPFLDQIRSHSPIPFEDVLGRRTSVISATPPGGTPPLVSLAVSIRAVGERTPFIAVADVRLDRILQRLTEQRLVEVAVIGPDGGIIAHRDVELLTGARKMEGHPIVRSAIESTLGLEMKPFEWQDRRWIGAHAPVGIGGLRVVAQVPESEIFRAAEQLINKSVLFAVILVTLAILIASVLARTFTDPIHRLVDATEKLSRGEFADTVHVKSHDEIAHLARSFNAMASDLQNQRAQLERNREELERKVKERTADLEDEKKKLAEAQENLIRTTRLASLGEVAGMAAHEVLNPVNNINIRLQKMSSSMSRQGQEDLSVLQAIAEGWNHAYQEGGWRKLAEDLQKAPEGGSSASTLVEEDLQNLVAILKDMTARQRELGGDFDFLQREITRITKIINNMRSLARVQGDRQPTDVHQPIDDTLTTLNEQFQRRGISLEKDYGAETRDKYTIMADRDELVQVFSNLIRNALQAVSSAQRREGRVVISTRRTPERVEIRITDNGTGIRSGDAPKIFEADFTTKSVTDGTGLGLSISRRLIRAFGGDIELESSQEGVGTTFLIWLPPMA